MRMLRYRWFRHSTIALCSIVVASGCIINRGNLSAAYTKIVPRQYCPNDAMTASYDLLASDVCPADVSCSTFFPTVAITSTPTAFAPQSITNYVGAVEFAAPDADRFSVLFDPANNDVHIPTAEVRPGHGRVFIVRESPNQAVNASRISTVNQELTHGGMCAGNVPVNTPQPLPGLPDFSANLRLNDLCNINPVTVVVTLSGGADGASYTQTLTPGQCLAAMPGVPSSTQNARLVDVRPQSIDPSVRCTATGPNMPPPPLRTLARLSCR